MARPVVTEEMILATFTPGELETAIENLSSYKDHEDLVTWSHSQDITPEQMQTFAAFARTFKGTSIRSESGYTAIRRNKTHAEKLESVVSDRRYAMLYDKSSKHYLADVEDAK